MRHTILQRVAIGGLCTLLAGGAAAVPVDPDGITALVTPAADLAPGLKPFQPGGHGSFHVTGWTEASQHAIWPITVPRADDYAVRVLVRRESGAAVEVRVESGTTRATGTLAADTDGWQRLPLAGLLRLGPTSRDITLRLAPADGTTAFAADVHAVELVRPDARDVLHDQALRLRADTAWFRKARYGVMVHWTSDTMPLQGDPRSYADAVDAFDVERFAATISRTGAGFLVFTTSHARMFFPAPLEALDRVLPGRTARRDLVADLAAALERRGVRLMLYFHQGSAGDPEWLRASGFDDPDSAGFYAHWRAIVAEAGRRYGERLAGWWFDDGATAYYPRNPPWEALDRAAKAGFAGRLVCFSPWELASPTEFQDFFAGEGCADPRGAGALLVRGGDGRYPSGPHAGLQASACLVAQRDWVHDRRDAPFNPPRWTERQLAALLREFAAHGNVPILNLEIAQGGEIAADVVDVIGCAGRAGP